MNFLSAITSTGHRRTITTWVAHPIKALAFGTAIWSIYQAIFTDIDVMVMTIIFLSLNLCLAFLIITPTKFSAVDRIPVYDYLFAAISIAGGLHFGFKIDEIATRIALFDALTLWDIFFTSALLLLLLEASRRTVGFDMAILTFVFFGYNLFGYMMPDIIRQNGVSYLHYIDIAFFTTDGVFGVPLRVAATYAFIFVIFGTLLTRCGAGEFFYRLAASVSGSRAGGPAKVAVISSGLFGSVSGNPVADVMTTGSVTIPIMIRSGFKPVIAAAIEATASNGGSLMPPVMGAAAFIMAEFTGITYAAIATAAIIPALLYYVSLYAQVHFYSKKNKMEGLPKDQVPRFLAVLKADVPFLIPIAVLLLVLWLGYSPSMVAFAASIAVIVSASLRRSSRLGLTAIYNELSEATERMMPVALTCAAAGLILAGMTMTGLANKFSDVILAIAGDNLTIALVCAALLTNILGLGLPTSATYILAAALIGSTLTKLGLSLMQAHFFLLYYAAMSALTPPVAISSYAAAALARTNPFATSLYSMRKATVAFLVPFGFVYHGELLLQGSWGGIAIFALMSSVGVILIAAAFERYFIEPLRGWECALLAAAGFLFLVGGYEGQIAGVIITLCGLSRVGLDWYRRNSRPNVAAVRPGPSRAPLDLPINPLEARND